MQTKTVKVGNLSDLATEREIYDFFSFSGEIDHIEICRETAKSRTAFVTFKEERALEIALLLSDREASVADYRVQGTGSSGWRPIFVRDSFDDNDTLVRIFRKLSEINSHGYTSDKGATLVDRIVTITLAENYVVTHNTEVRVVENAVSRTNSEDTSTNVEVKTGMSNGKVYVNKAQEVVSNMIARGFAIRQDAVSKAKAFDEKHRLTASASAKVLSFDKRVGLTEKLTVGISVVNEKVKSVDQRLHVSDKTMAAILAAERKLNNTGSAVKSSRYVTAGAAWLNGAFSKVAKAGHVAGTKTREKFHMAVSNLTAKDPIAA